jgi:hypothetical protein
LITKNHKTTLVGRSPQVLDDEIFVCVLLFTFSSTQDLLDHLLEHLLQQVLEQVLERERPCVKYHFFFPNRTRACSSRWHLLLARRHLTLQLRLRQELLAA